MSKFADKLGSIYKTVAPSLGFHKPTEEAKLPSLLLVATISETGTKKIKGGIENGIDAAVVSSENIGTVNSRDLIADMNGIPIGLSLADDSRENIQELIKLDWDFVIFGLKIPAEAINKEGLGKILKIEPSLPPGLVRAINESSLDIDAVLIADGSYTVTVERLLVGQFLASMLNKPLLVNVDTPLTSGELSSLCEAGIRGLILPEGTSLKAFVELKKLISNLPQPFKRRTKARVILPHIGIAEPKEEKEEEEEDI